MIRQTGLIVVILLLLAAPSVQAQSTPAVGGLDPGPAAPAQEAGHGIAVLASGVEKDFPVQARFTLEAESDADIVDVRLRYRVDRMKHVEVVSEGWAEFEPASVIEAHWVWDMRLASLPPGAVVTYWWTIEDAAGNTVETSPETMRFDDDRYEWRSLTAGGFLEGCGEDVEVTLYWYQGSESFARELLDVCEEGLARLTEEIGTCPNRPIEIYIYASSQDLRGAMVFPQEWTGGVAYTEFSTIAIGIPPGGSDWGKRALVHELTHLVVHQVTYSPYGQLPTWLDEGLATHNEGELLPDLRSRLEWAAHEGRLISVRSLASPFSAQPEQAYLSYAQSYSLVEYLLVNYGQDSMMELLTLLTEGSSYDEALRAVYGFDMDGLDDRWRQTLADVVPPEPPRDWFGPAMVVLAAVLVGLIAIAVLLVRRRK